MENTSAFKNTLKEKYYSIKRIVNTFVCIQIILLVSSHTTFGYKVFPTIAESDLMFDKANFPFIAEHADGIRVQHKGLSTFSEAQVQLMLDQYTNKKFIMHAVYSGKDITSTGSIGRVPSYSNIEAMFLYTEAPAMSTDEWRDVLDQNPPFPVITHCRSFANDIRHQDLRDQILLTSGVVFEMRVDDKSKYDDAAAMIKYCVDNGKIASFLTTFQVSREYFLSAYKEFYYYLKENLPAEYLQSDKVIFMPNTYSDSQVFPDTPGSGGTFGVGRWLIEQKDKIGDNFIQPKINITSPQSKDFFPNNYNLVVNVDGEADVTSVKLYIDNELVGTDNNRPFNFSGGSLDGMRTGVYDVKAVGINSNGDEGTSVIQVRILESAIPVPGNVLPGQGSNFKAGLVPTAHGTFNFVRRNDWFDLKLNVQNEGFYDVDMDVKVKRPKYFGGTVILNKGNQELGRVSTILNDPAEPALPGFTENPEMVIRGVYLERGEQTIRVSFTLASTTINRPIFSLGNFQFRLQDGPEITVTSPSKNIDVDAPGNIAVRANIISPRTQGTITQAELFVNGESVEIINGTGPFNWNLNNDLPSLSNLERGNYDIKIIATDDIGYTNFDEFLIKVINRRPFNTSLKIPGTIEAYEYDLGGTNVGYTDFNEGIERGLSGSDNPRFERAGNEDTEIEKIGNNYTVSAIRDKESLIYTLNSVEAGTYTIKALAATRTGKKAEIDVYLDHQKIASIPISETGNGFSIYKEFEVANINIPDDKRQSNLRLVFKNVNTSGYLFFLRQLEFIKTDDVANQPPSVSLTSPTNNTTFGLGQEISLNANASDPDGNLDKVNFFINDEIYFSDVARPFGTVFTPTTPGTYRIVARAIDQENAKTDATVTITVEENNQAPTASFTTPTGTRIEEGYPELIVTVDANDPEGDAFTVLLKINGQEIRTESRAPYEWGHAGSPSPEETLGLLAGEHLLEAVVTDVNGASTTISKRITVDNITSTTAELEKNKLTVYPNPSESGIFKLSLSTDFKVHNIDGVVMLTDSGDKIDLSSFPKGVYFLKANHINIKLVR